MERSTETLLRWTCITWLWVFAVLAGLGAGQMVKNGLSQLVGMHPRSLRLAEHLGVPREVITSPG